MTIAFPFQKYPRAELLKVVFIFGCFFQAGTVLAQCNGGVTVTTTLVVNSSCAGGNVKGLTLDTGANVIINSGATVSNDAGSGSSGRAVVVLSSSTSALLTNNGTIYTGSQWGLWTQPGSQVSVVNTGLITAATQRYGIANTGTITSLTNIGSISGAWAGISSGVSTSAITVFNNLQGQSGSTSTPVSLVGYLPLSYNIIINGANSYGQLSGGSGPMTFGIYGGSTGFTPITYTNSSGGTSSIAASSVSAGTYTDVLQGFSSLTGITGTTGSYSGYNYSLVADTLHSGDWNLVFVPGSTSILSRATNLLSGVGSSLNPVFDGGTLKVDTAGANSTPFSITANNGMIDQNSSTSNFTGNITNSGAGINGKLTIINSGSGGSVTLSGNNAYSGGTEVDAGANLSISSANNIGTGALALVGSSTSPATLITTASMTISNSITVTADPVFNVASGTTTTVSTPIADGSSAGDVVVSGGGTLALTAANTYTGLTAVNAGSTLALVGAGSIMPSSALNNSGTVDVRSANGNVALGGTFTQTSTGNLLMNISPTNNQQINVTGAAALAGGLSLNATAGTYAAGKYTLLTANGVTGTFGTFASNLSSYTRLGYALGYDANDVYLYLTPNVADTQQSLVNNASALQNIFTLQNTVLANSFSYDCNVFGEHDVCVSAGGRNTAVSAANGLNNTSALLIASYRLDENNSRVGAYADQNLSMNQAGNTVNLGNNTPLIGLFAAWNENADGTGTEVKAGIAYGQKNATVTRQVVNTSEPGTGSSQLNSQGAQVTAKYGFALDEQVIVSPYIGMRYTQNNMGGYTEATSAAVTSPLTYAALNTNATTALAGVGASYRFIPQATAFASAGVETDTNTSNGTYSATGVSGLTPINFNANPVKTRPTAMLGAYYDVMKNQRLGITGIYRQEPYQRVSTTTVMATYTIGM